jgi:putative membrane protein
MSVQVARDLTPQQRSGIGATTAPALGSAGAVLLAGIPLMLLHDIGQLSQHMALHILSMNVVAPLAAATLVYRGAARPIAARYLWTLTAAQMLALWLLHTPRFHAVAAHEPALALLAHALLGCLALGFWIALLRLGQPQRWHAPAALLLTGKLACLLAALLIFSPRLLYLVHTHGEEVSLDDQQLAGLLMIVACPLSYLTAAVLITCALIVPQDADGGKITASEMPRHAP